MTNRAKYLETKGNLSFSNWFKARDDETGKTEVLPHRTQYVLDKGARGGEQIWFLINMPVSSRNITVDVREGNETNTVNIVDWQAKAEGKAPMAAKAVLKEVMPWFRPLAESGFTKPIVTKDDGKVIFVDKGPYHVYWCAFDGRLSFVNIEKRDKDSPDGASLQIQYDTQPPAQILYFNRDGSVIGTKFDDCDILERAWAKPVLPLNPNNTRYEDIKVDCGGLGSTAYGLLWELQDVLRDAVRVKRRVALDDIGRKLLRRQ